jgi:hypothetical protein
MPEQQGPFDLPLDVWLGMATPLLAPDDPHQECYRRAIEQGVGDVNLVCTCEPPACDKTCCATRYDDWSWT